MKFDLHNGMWRVSLVMVAMVTAFSLPVSAQQAAPVAVAPAAAAAAPDAKPLDELDEVVVKGGRLYDRIVKAEDKFFKLYNELNKDDDFDTHCAFVPIEEGSRMEQRFCMPSFFADAKAEQVRLSQYCLSLAQKDEEGRPLSQGACYEPPSAEMIFFSKRDAYVDNVLKVIGSDPRLKEMASELNDLHRERDQLAHRYDDIKAREVALKGEKRVPRTTVR